MTETKMVNKMLGQPVQIPYDQEIRTTVLPTEISFGNKKWIISVLSNVVTTGHM